MKISIIFLLLIPSFAAYAQIGEPFPLLEGENLKNVEITIPNSTNGRYTLVAVAFSKPSEQELLVWSDHIYNHFIRTPEAGGFFSFDYDLNVYFLPLETGSKRVGHKIVMKNMLTTMDSLLHEHILFYEGKSKHYRQPLYYQGWDVPYFYVVDPEGKIAYMTKGKYDAKILQKITNAVEPAIK